MEKAEKGLYFSFFSSTIEREGNPHRQNGESDWERICRRARIRDEEVRRRHEPDL